MRRSSSTARTPGIEPSGTIGIVPAWYQQWLKSAIKMMMGIGTPSRKSKIERIVKPPQLVL
jgi:hypothetical protein